MHFEVVQAGLGDLTSLIRLERACFEYDAWPIWDMMGILVLPGTVHLKAVVEGQMAGFVGCDTRMTPGVGWIATIGVYPRYRRLGIATALLRRAETEMGMAVVRLSVRRSNQGAFALYLREGYRMADIWHRYYGNGEDALILEKKVGEGG